MNVRNLARNGCLAAATVLEHLGDDPAVLALQVSRRLPASLVRPLAAAASIAPGQLLPALGALVQGRNDDVKDRLSQTVDSGIGARAKVRLADVATAAAMPEIADNLLAAAPETTRGWAGAQARLRWYRGDMSGAVEVLGSGRTTVGERRQRTRLASELGVFDGWTPSLPPVQEYVPRAQSVLHLLTNSLPYTGSGYAQRSHSLLKAQSDSGWNVHAATRIGYPVQIGRLGAADTDLIDGVTYHRLLPARLPKGMAARLQLQTEELLKLALEVRPAVLHTTTHFVNGLVVRAVAESLGIPWIYEVRGQLADTWASTRGDEAKLSERYRKFGVREADVMGSAGTVATLGEAMRAGIVEAGVAVEQTLLLPNAVGEGFLQEPATPAAARAQLGLPAEGLFIGTVSSLVDYEGLDDLLHAFALLAPRYPALRCLIVGDGVAGPGLKRLTVDLGLQDRTFFTGRVPREQAHLYHQALDIFVVPRKDFPVTRMVTPLKPVEALASGRPVVFSALPALHEVLRDGIDGLSAQPEDPADLAQSLAVLLRDDARRLDMGREGRRYTVMTRTWTSLADATAQTYMEMESAS
ncbi:glycosyltransferase family 4 protein [Arthrobacter caoxuetaonis]|uniref:glycosyltransferase family 4 protein n=1 Tax=Arthrobacter caoxuetaonis TaxID=2886935 RepID=UPI001D15A5FA|nr:glycosyltransferase family 4 protein [Arthrobacter caoxuetaonis]MCC3282467.1 glycosyltransferase family 4 protein [Arthrobacter caoxuetaonis]